MPETQNFSQNENVDVGQTRRKDGRGKEPSKVSQKSAARNVSRFNVNL